MFSNTRCPLYIDPLNIDLLTACSLLLTRIFVQFSNVTSDANNFDGSCVSRDQPRLIARVIIN